MSAELALILDMAFLQMKGKMEIAVFINLFTQRRPIHEILQSAAQVLLQRRSACQENVCLHLKPKGKGTGSPENQNRR